MRVLPFFVYGTLLPGQPNYTLWQNAIDDLQPATFAKGMLFSFGAYPMLVENQNRLVKGALVTVKSAEYEGIIRDLDMLEGFDPVRPDECIYRRVVRAVHLNDGIQTQAWVYIGRSESVAGARLIESGDWVVHSAPISNDIAAWWKIRGHSLILGDSE